ncbi:MAG TPA: hypothetical protein VLY45_04165 [Nitrospiria bacterium]|nr:hypothetical protein [Nitrospiria bacterium]
MGWAMPGLLAALAVGLLAGSPAWATRQIDNLLLSKIIWGMPSDRVAQALKLERSQYTILHDPVEGNVTIFQLDGKTLNFPEFRQVYLNFKPETGLFKVYGFYLGSLKDAVAALKHRYGEPDEVRHTSLVQTYQWNFQETTLSLNNSEFEITLK